MKALATNPKTDKKELCRILSGYHGWQDGVLFDEDSTPFDPSCVYGRNELYDLEEFYEE